MWIDAIDAEPVDVLRYLNAARGGGTEVARLPLVRARVRGLPAALDALILASDLQGIVPGSWGGEATLLGIAVASWCASLAEDDRLPRADRIGVVLAGDLYSVPAADKRGGYGDVAPVWQAFAHRFRWVVGVAGNHDDVSRLERRIPPGVHLLDGAVTELDGLRIGGVGRIAGNPGKPGRRDEEEQLVLLDLVTEARPDVLVLHEGPPGVLPMGERGGTRQPGNPEVAERLARHPVPFTACGHVRWDEPLAALGAGQVVNLEGRVVVATRT